MKPKTIFALAGIALLAVLLFLLLQKKETEYYTLQRVDIEYKILATCTVRFPEPYDLTAKAAGDVVRIPVVEGQAVKQGDLLVQIDDFREKQNLAIAESNYEKVKLKILNSKEAAYPRLREQLNDARVSLQEARNHAERIRRLLGAGGVTKVEWEAAESRLKETRARFNQVNLQVEAYSRSGPAAELIQELNSLDAQVQLARRAVNDKHLVAPYDGVVVKLDAREGETLRLDQNVVIVLEDKPWVLEAGVDQRELPFLEAGLPCTIVLDAFPAEKIRGRVSLVCSVVDFAKGTCTLKIRVDENRPFIKHGMTGTVEIIGKKREKVNANVLALPARYLDRDTQGDFVWIRTGGKRIRTAVEVIPIGEKWVSVTNLPEGTRITLPE